MLRFKALNDPRAADADAGSRSSRGLARDLGPDRAAARARLRVLARVRRRYGRLFLALPLLLVVLADLHIRGDRLLDLSGKHVASYLGAMVESAALWGLLLFAASSRRGASRWIAALLFVTLATLSLGGQLYFHRQYATYLNLDATLFGTSLSSSLFGQLRADGENFLHSVLPPLVLAIALVWLGRRIVRPGRTAGARAARLAAPAAVVAAFVLPCSYRTVQASTPDVIYFHAIGGLLKELAGVQTTAQVRPGLRTPPALPRLTPEPGPRRNVLFILTESVRADATCSAPAGDGAAPADDGGGAAACPGTPRIDAAAPGRLPLLQMRSNASTTAIGLAVLWSGLQPIATREELHTAPLVFDYADAAGFDSAYWTSHHMMFANSRLYVQDLPVSHQCGATELDPLADIDLGADDRLLSAHVRSEVLSLREPFLAVAHFGNTHVPYLVDPEDAPFQPALESKAPDDNEAYRNFYRNAVYRQDAAIADLIRFVRSSPVGERTVIVFTSDHGEAFREHGQLGHTGSILEEEIRVPGWIDAPPGTLTAAEEAGLRAARDEPVFHTDVAPTLLDLMGLWEEPALAAYRAAMVGHSLLRPSPGPAALALTNCTGIWGCAFKNWGMMRGNMKLESRAWDTAWHCYDVLADPREQHDLGPAACGDLPRLADAIYGGPAGSVDVPVHLRDLAAGPRRD
ncbi:sulfatase-like hydrolase/transferase [Sorangium sp. So ce362]|uniref:sulfatase-like hydrolase/transferase n=1 Tax=Sorangium sp. So ce362 TaxID=3133303 RepID=UPI003F5ECAA7